MASKCIDSVDVKFDAPNTCKTNCEPEREFFNLGSSTCNACSENCVECTSGVAHHCIKCKNKFRLVFGACYASCPEGTSNDLTDPSLCTIIPDVVVTCSPESYRFRGQCVIRCPTSTFPRNGVCEYCPSRCEKCKSGFSCDKCRGDLTYDEDRNRCSKDPSPIFIRISWIFWIWCCCCIPIYFFLILMGICQGLTLSNLSKPPFNPSRPKEEEFQIEQYPRRIVFLSWLAVDGSNAAPGQSCPPPRHPCFSERR